MARSSARSFYSIAAVSKLTGISCHTLRVWERRYGFPTPLRSPSGHRRYGADQVRTLQRLAQLVREGRSIGDVMTDLRAGRVEELSVAAPTTGPVVDPTVSALVDQLVVGDLAGAEEHYRAAAQGVSPADLIEQALEPTLVEIGERWFRGECDVFQEHVATEFVRRKLEGLLDAALRANAQPKGTAIVGTVLGDRHAGGVLIVSTLLELARWRVLTLGVDLPVRDYQAAVDSWKPDALALSFVLSRNINKRFEELSRIRGVPIFVGGRSILNYQRLARQYGLIPLPGPAPSAVRQLLDHFPEPGARPT